jgi:uncharacterized protein (TIGR02145 family)
MNYPLISEYIDAIKAAEDNFEELKNLRPVLDDDGQPVMSSGNFAVVFKMTDGKKNYAVKCFTKAQDSRGSAYKLISEELEKIQSPYILKVRYLEKELFVDTSQSDETEFPVLIMDWVDGQTLSSFLQNIVNNYDEDYSFWSEEDEKTALFELKCLPYNFIRTASWLIKQPFAHGDIKPDNIIIKPDGTCVLVDYDGMYVPAMQGMKMQCMGTPNYRYPSVKEQRFDNSLDNYSISVIALSLCAFALEPQNVCDYNDFCIITEKETSKLHEHRLFKDEVLMSDNLFRDLLAIYLHTLSQNKLDSDYYDSCISEYLCPDNYDISSTKVADYEKENYWEDKYGVRYSLDGRKVISASKELKGMDYKIREGVLTICEAAFQGKKLHSITLPDSVVAIGAVAFANNDDMEYCNIPSSVRFIYDNNPWGGCFNIKRMECKSSYYVIRDGLLYSSDFDIVYGLIYWNSYINIDLRTKKIASNAIWSNRKKYNSFIKKIELSNVIKIGNSAFSLCKNAKFSSSNMIEDVGEESFMFCELLEEIDISNVKNIPEQAFSYCTNLKNVKFSEKLESIGKKAFQGCINLSEINLAKTVCYISIDSLDDCRSLTDINVNSDNEYYCSIEGVLFNKNITKLLKYPSGKQASEYEIPQSVNEIGDKAFKDCKSLKVIRCKNEIKSFGERVFENCPNLNTCLIDICDKPKNEKQKYGYFTDPRDGYTYKTIKIGGQTWLAENLRYLPSINDGYYVYGYHGDDIAEAKRTPNYEEYGVLYDVISAQEACPQGWHIPTDEEWKALELYIGMPIDEVDLVEDNGLDHIVPYRGKRIGSALLDINSEYKQGALIEQKNTDFGFDARLAGWRTFHGDYESINELCRWWTTRIITPDDSSAHDYDFYTYRELFYAKSGIGNGYCAQLCCLSLRCIKDDDNNTNQIDTDYLPF